MTMLAPKSNSLTIPRIDDEIYKLVDYFYPRRDFMQVLQLYMRTDDIMNIMNCNYEEALKLYYEIRGYFGDNEMRILITHFTTIWRSTNYSSTFFLASLKEHHKFKPRKKRVETKPDDGYPASRRPLSLAQVIENLPNGLHDSPETIQERINIQVNQIEFKRIRTYKNERKRIIAN